MTFEESMDLHGYIVGNDGLLLKLILLEDVGLEDLLKLCRGLLAKKQLPLSGLSSNDN